ncbi:MAG: 4Fe-4S dicluster domain-containing protein [Lachnospiraceae bacterium]|nr:4Fe-4S dicluster domain-containing protein [Lachnospiraceae bacterium]
MREGSRIQLQIVRRESTEAPPYLQRILYETPDPNATVATALTDINKNPNQKDTEGNVVTPIGWECNCLQKKCGACAMLINNRPMLACDTKLSEYGKKGVIRVEPLKKFPVIRDLIVDRSILQENLKTIKAWLEEPVLLKDKQYDVAYEASRCLQCGCCLEICPNFYAGGTFAGTAALVPVSRLLAELPREEQKKLAKAYREHVFEGCGKSLACRKVCPAGIDVDKLLVNSNAMAIWKKQL